MQTDNVVVVVSSTLEYVAEVVTLDPPASSLRTLFLKSVVAPPVVVPSNDSTIGVSRSSKSFLSRMPTPLAYRSSLPLDLYGRYKSCNRLSCSFVREEPVEVVVVVVVVVVLTVVTGHKAPFAVVAQQNITMTNNNAWMIFIGRRA